MVLHDTPHDHPLRYGFQLLDQRYEREVFHSSILARFFSPAGVAKPTGGSMARSNNDVGRVFFCMALRLQIQGVRKTGAGKNRRRSDLYPPNQEQRRWVLPGRSRRETEVDVFTSKTARNKCIAPNPHRPKGFRRNGIVFVVVAASQCRGIYSLSTPRIQRRLARTLLLSRGVQATNPFTGEPEPVKIRWGRWIRY